jgi:hypothetical protein
MIKVIKDRHKNHQNYQIRYQNRLFIKFYYLCLQILNPNHMHKNKKVLNLVIFNLTNNQNIYQQ